MLIDAIGTPAGLVAFDAPFRAVRPYPFFDRARVIGWFPTRRRSAAERRTRSLS
ncbi:hypothetical protein GCM10027174_00970 [Salinifilum aidingensis]